MVDEGTSRRLASPWIGACAIIAFSFAATGCQFFGKQKDETVAATPGVLADGTSIVGSWSASYFTVASDGKPSVAVTMTFTFDPTGAVRLEERDAKTGVTCTGFGQYREPAKNEVLIYLQASSSTSCLFPAQIHMSQVAVGATYLRYVDPSNNAVSHLFKDRSQLAPPLGVWDFAGAGGIDFLFFDHHGYFILMTTIDNTSYLLQGYYVITGGTLTLKYFANGDPAQVGGTSVFTEFIMNDQNLRLIQTTTSGDIAYDAIRI